MAEIILGAILIIVTAVLAEEAPPKWRRWLWALFVALVVAQAVIQVRAKLAERRKDESADNSQRQLKNELDQSLLNQQYTKGQLDSLAMMVGKWAQPNTGNADLASAIKQIMKSGAQNVSDLKMSNLELCKRAHAKAQEIREFIAQHDRLSRDERDKYFARMQQTPPGPSRDAIWKEMTQYETRNYANNKAEFTNKYLADVKYLRDLIIERLPSQLADTVRTQNGSAETGLEVGEPVGYFNANETVIYLEVLADALCTKKQK